MNECRSCLGLGINYFVCSDPDFKLPPNTCNHCNGSGQDPIPPNETIRLLQMNPNELNEYFNNIPVNFIKSSFENNFYKIEMEYKSLRKNIEN